MNIHVQTLRGGTAERSTPMEIAHHGLFTAREKLELLRKLKAEVTAENVDVDVPGFTPEEIDLAIEEVKRGAGNSQDAEAVRRGDF